MYALPVLPPVIEAQVEQLEYLVSDLGVAGVSSAERSEMIYLMQTHAFINLANANEDTKWGDNYAVQAWRNYNAYLEYLD